jgi:hypothetical protein
MRALGIIAAIDDEIARLVQAKTLLASFNSGSSVIVKKVKRNLSPEARQRIIDAQKKRWAKQKKLAKK